MLTKAEKKAIRKAYKAVTWLDDRMQDLCNDPMTDAMGAPVEDFYEDWSRQHRRMLSDCLKDVNSTYEARTMVFNALECYLP